VRETGVFFQELAVVSDAGERKTNDVCEKLGERRYVIDGREITFPVRVNRAAMLVNAFVVDSHVAQGMIEGSGYRVAELLPGKTTLQLALIDYRENDLGDYNEAAINFPVLAPGEKKPFPFFGTLAGMARSSLSNYVYRMPVDQEFTTHAGRFIWGFPKWVARIDIEFGPDRASGRFIDEGEPVFSIGAKAGGSREQKEQRMSTLAVRDGRAWKTYGTSTGTGLTFGLGGELPTIGEKHPLAKELRALGLPKKPLFSMSMTEARMRFEPPECVEIGEPFQT
jgi:hypothetical protein